MGEIELPPITAITEVDRNGQFILDSAKERAINEIEEFIRVTKKINIKDIAKRLNVQWPTADGLVAEITEKWKGEDKKRLSEMKRKMSLLSKLVVDRLEEKGDTVTLGEVKSMIELVKDLQGLEKLETEPVGNTEDMKNVVAVHFNNMNLSSEMLKEIQKVKEEKNEIKPE